MTTSSLERAWKDIATVSFLVAVGMLGVAPDADAMTSVYAWGGNNGGPTSDVYAAQVTAPGTLGPWTLQTAYPTAVKELYGFVDCGFLYSFGGCSSPLACLADVYSAPLGGGGALGAWISTTTLPAPRYQPVMLTDHAGYAYALSGSGQPTVWTAPISGGAVGAWTVQAPPPFADNEHCGVFLNGYAYLVTGVTSVYSAPANAGTVGAWASQAPLPYSAGGGSYPYSGWAVASCNCLYVMGGYVGAINIAYPDVYYACPTNGTISAWTSTTAMPVGLYEFAAVIADGYLFTMGGNTSTGAGWTSAIYAAQILPSGALGTWTSTTAIPPSVSQEFAAASWPPPTQCSSPCVVLSSTPTATPTITTTPPFSPTVTQTYTRSPTATVSSTVTQRGTSTWTGSPTNTFTPSATITNTFTITATPTITLTFTVTLTPTATPTLFPPYLFVDRNLLPRGSGPLNIRFALAADADNVQIAVFNSAGELVKIVWNAPVQADTDYRLTWSATNYLGNRVSSNVYIVRLFAPSLLLLRMVAVVQ